jgi:hypothetical protein
MKFFVRRSIVLGLFFASLSIQASVSTVAQFDAKVKAPYAMAMLYNSQDKNEKLGQLIKTFDKFQKGKFFSCIKFVFVRADVSKTGLNDLPNEYALSAVSEPTFVLFQDGQIVTDNGSKAVMQGYLMPEDLFDFIDDWFGDDFEEKVKNGDCGASVQPNEEYIEKSKAAATEDEGSEQEESDVNYTQSPWGPGCFYSFPYWYCNGTPYWYPYAYGFDAGFWFWPWRTGWWWGFGLGLGWGWGWGGRGWRGDRRDHNRHNRQNRRSNGRRSGTNRSRNRTNASRRTTAGRTSARTSSATRTGGATRTSSVSRSAGTRTGVSRSTMSRGSFSRGGGGGFGRGGGFHGGGHGGGGHGGHR